MKHSLRNLITVGLTMFAGASAYAQSVEINVWHSLSGPNRSTFERIVDQFNSQQKDVQIDLTRFSSQADLAKAAQAAIKGDRAKPDLVQLHDTHAPEIIAQHKDILPLYQLLSRHPIKDASWFLEKTTSFVRDDKGRLLAFPLMSEVPVMFYNRDAYRSAGLDPNKPATTWAELQGHLLELRNVGNYQCPYASSHQVNIHLENLAPINDEFYLKPDNGLKGTRNLSFNFGTLHMRHLSLMVSWRKTDLFTESTDGNKADDAFAQGRCAVLTSTSSALGTVRAGGVNFGIAPLPFYPQETKVSGAPFVGGGALWVVGGQSAQRNKASAQFLAFLATPVVAAQWHQQTGFLPLTDAAFRAADVSFYDRIPGARNLINQIQKASDRESAGFRAPHYPQARVILNKGLDRALSGEVSPMSALLDAKQPAEQMIRTGK